MIDNLQSTDYAYLAGLFDGEGCIYIYHTTKEYLALSVRLGVTQRFIAEYYQSVFGGSVHRHDYPGKDGYRRRVMWYWQAPSLIAERFLKAVYPYLLIKKPQAEVALKFQVAKAEKGRRFHRSEISAVEQAQKILISNMNNGVDNAIKEG